MSGKIVVVDHPLVQHKLTLLRNKETGTKDFRFIVGEIAMLMMYDAMRNLPLEEVEIETPITKTTCKKISGKTLAFIPILRSGLGMVEGAIQLIPSAKVGHIGLCRDEETFQPIEYYCKLPADIEKREVYVLDPMLATGGSAIDAIAQIKKRNPKSIKFLCIIASEEGLNALSNAHPDVDIFCAGVDKALNEDK
ncbi:MAG TPA: uracil phosphoribosyltransferase, partial [Porphyromonadaceae bacterium]|nr:uracil phosphoribosyltransferase [Porphyromonadaceae bacterium]